MKPLIWCALGVLAALLFWAVAHASEPSFVDFGAILWVGDSLTDIVKDSEGGQMPSQEEFNRRGGGSHQPGARSADPNSGSNGEIPGADSTPSMKEGESHTGRIDVPVRRPELSEGDLTPPRAPDAGGPGRILAPPAVHVFMGWSERGIFLGGKIFDTAEDCQAKRDEDREQHPLVQFSACTEIPAVRETL